MKQIIAFIKKEFMEIIRTGKAYILVILFTIFGIMNPAIAKLSPWMYEMFADSLKNQGISIGKIVVTAQTSWEQYYKNLSMQFIVLVIMFCGVLTSEYQKGTLINMLTKGLPRWKVIITKAFAVLVSWSICFWLCFGITYAYNAYFWDNHIVNHILFAAIGSYLFGIWLISVILLSSTFLDSSSAVLLTTGVIYAITYLLSMIPNTTGYLPTKLTSGMELLTGVAKIEDYTTSVSITIILIILGTVLTIVRFDRKKI